MGKLISTPGTKDFIRILLSFPNKHTQDTTKFTCEGETSVNCKCCHADTVFIMSCTRSCKLPMGSCKLWMQTVAKILLTWQHFWTYVFTGPCYKAILNETKELLIIIMSWFWYLGYDWTVKCRCHHIIKFLHQWRHKPTEAETKWLTFLLIVF